MLKVSLIALVILPLLAIGYLFVLGRISQKGEAPGLVDGKLAACPATPNCVSSEAIDPAQAVAALGFDPAKLSPEAAWKMAGEAVQSLPGAEIISVTDRYLSAECSSKVFGFIDDLELQLRPDQSEIAVRSASRTGRSDFGINRNRIELLRAKFEASNP